MGASQIELLRKDFQNLYSSLPERVQRPEILYEDVLNLVFEFGRNSVIAEQLCARGIALQVTDAASYAEAGVILSEASAMIQDCEQKCNALFTDFELWEKFQGFREELGTILEKKMEAWERRDRRRKLAPAQVLEMHREYDTGQVSMRQLAKRFGISVSTVSNIINGRYWKE